MVWIYHRLKIFNLTLGRYILSLFDIYESWKIHSLFVLEISYSRLNLLAVFKIYVK